MARTSLSLHKIGKQVVYRLPCSDQRQEGMTLLMRQIQGHLQTKRPYCQLSSRHFPHHEAQRADNPRATKATDL